MDTVTFTCRCGETHWQAPAVKSAARLVCYCKDCQAFANHLNASHVLDENGGTEITQTSPKSVTFTKGADNIKCLRLSPAGLMRWYAGCCDTPIANTLPNPGVPFIGFLMANAQGPHEKFGPVLALANTKGARGPGAPTEDKGLKTVMAMFAKRAAGARLTGAYKDNPFFNFPERQPIVTPHVITKTERNAATPK